MVVALVVAALPVGTRAAPPPDVVGQPLRTARPALEQWRPDVQISYVPELAKLPAGTDPEEAGVAQVAVFNRAGQADPEGPVVQLTLAALAPSLIGLDRATGQELLTRHGLVGVFVPRTAPPTYQVAAQRPLPGQLVAFGSRVFTEMLPGRPASAPPTSDPPEPPETTAAAVPAEVTPPDEWSPAATFTVTGLVLLVLLLLALAGLLTLRARRVRARPPVAQLTVVARAGPPTEPALTTSGGTGLSIRLEPHLDRGPQVLLEEGTP